MRETYDQIHVVGSAERNFFSQNKILPPFRIILPGQKKEPGTQLLFCIQLQLY